MGYEELVDETYRYLYDTAAYYGTGVEYLIGGIAVGSLLLLWIIARLARGKRKEEIIVKVLKSEEPERGEGITISPEEVLITGEGKTTKLLKDAFKIDMKVGKLEIMVKEPTPAAAAAAAAPRVEAVGEPEAPAPEEAPEEAPVEEPVEEARPVTFGGAMRGMTRKYTLETVTLITPEGLLMDSTSKTPEEDATLATALLSKLKLGKKSTRLEINKDGIKYMFSIPHGESHAVFLARAEKKLAKKDLDALEGELKESLKLLPG